MIIPTPDEFCARRGYSPFPSRWNRWLSQVRDVVVNAQPMKGRNVEVHEYEGKGTVIDVANRKPAGTAACPATVYLSFHGVTFDCGCTFFTPALASTFQVTDPANVNSLVTRLDLVVGAFTDCGDCLDGSGNHQFWRSTHLDDTHLPHVITSFWSNTNCSGPPSSTGNEFLVFPVMTLNSGTYSLFAFLSSTDTMIFYGTTTDLTIPIANTLSCNTNYASFSNPAVRCQYGGNHSLNVIAHGGTASFAFS